MTNEEVDLEVLKTMTGIEEDFNSLIKGSVALIQENTKLKAEIEQLKATISKMGTTTAQEDDLK